MHFLRRAAVVLALAAGAFAAYLPYAFARTGYGDDLGVHPAQSAAGTLGAMFTCSVLLLPVALWETRRTRPLSWFPWTLSGTVLAGALLGCVVAEAVLLGHEAAFRAEVAANPAVAHGSARPWPFGNGSIYYAPGRGYWATD